MTDGKVIYTYGRNIPWGHQMITQRQYEYLEAINSFHRKNLRAPTLRELAKELGDLSKEGVRHMLQKLKQRGLVVWEADCARTLRTTGFKRKIVYGGRRGGYIMFWD